MTHFTSGNTLAFLLSDGARLYRQAFERTIAESGSGLTPGEVRTLGHALRYHGSRQAVLAERMGIEPMTLSAYLDRLEARGLIRREVDRTDRRAKIIHPTDEAARLMQQLSPLFQKIYDEATRDIDEETMRACVQALIGIRSNLTSDPELLGSLDPSKPEDLTGRPVA
ncbi:hypothetical protein LA66_01220 [Aureimonas altamirensis]|uniref:HTH marR-type domain-containing protein n=1 Tax=Aureimonas altamirensis TaxID=370622 RepID=A0A0B1Q8R0_9HYPH|nr:MarR family transcriptional regulator [Aureimonas altamirensis]KHJ55322.1 hypothetical protein LA66_01220 [Aureimonas altamirensis]